MMTKLLPCAHCGSNDVHLVREVVNDVILWRIACRDCGMSTARYPEMKKAHADSWVEHDEAIELMNASIECATTVWNTRAENCPSASLDLEEKSNDELVAIAKECQDVLGRKALRLLERMKEIIEEDNNE